MIFRGMMRCVCCAAAMCGIAMIIEVDGMEPGVRLAEDNEKIIFNFEPLKAALAPDREKFTPEYVNGFMQTRCTSEIVREQAKNVFLTGDSESYSTLGYNIRTNYFAPDFRKFFANDSDQCVADFLINGTIIITFNAIEKNRRLLQRAFDSVLCSITYYGDILSGYFVTDLEKLKKIANDVKILNPDIYKGFDCWE